MPKPLELHEVLLYVITYDLLSIRICHNLSKSAAKLLLFFDMSDHEIVGGCSTSVAKSNKKMHFSRPRSCVYQKNVVPLQRKVV